MHGCSGKSRRKLAKLIFSGQETPPKISQTNFRRPEKAAKKGRRKLGKLIFGSHKKPPKITLPNFRRLFYGR